jgi:hypothetical protein
MDFLYRSITPSYKGSTGAAVPSGGIGGVLQGLLGSGQPAYRQQGGPSSAMPSPTRSWFGFGGTPPYKVAPAPPEPEPDAPTPRPMICVCAELGSNQSNGCNALSDEELAELYVW